MPQLGVALLLDLGRQDAAVHVDRAAELRGGAVAHDVRHQGRAVAVDDAALHHNQRVVLQPVHHPLRQRGRRVDDVLVLLVPDAAHDQLVRPVGPPVHGDPEDPPIRLGVRDGHPRARRRGRGRIEDGPGARQRHSKHGGSLIGT